MEGVSPVFGEDDLKAVGVFGGTFNPVQIGHLRTCVELRQHLGLAYIHLIPNATPPHRQVPGVSAEDRLAMLRLAIDGEPGLLADDRELRRSGPSFAIDTLADLRTELGAGASLMMCIGMDGLVNLADWYRWRELLDFAHIVVAARPGWRQPAEGVVARWLDDKLEHDVAVLKAEPSGKVLIREMTLLPVSSTEIRSVLSSGLSARYLLPDAVLDYIVRHQLYGTGGI